MDATFAGLTHDEKRHALSKFLLARITGPERPHPLAYSQESRWALTMSAVESGVENHTFAWRLSSALNPQALRLAVTTLLKRYSCLRSVFGTYEGKAVRYVQREFATPFEVYDRTAATGAAISAEIAQAASMPFDLRSGPVLRVQLFEMPLQEQVLLLTAHHILADFWSLGIALRTLAELYMKIAASLPIESPGDEPDYDTFVLWEAKRVLGAPGEDALRYWGNQFADGLDFVQVPADRPWPAARGFRDAEYRFTIGDGAVDRLRRVGQENDCTLFAVMLALFNVLIYTYTRQRSIAVISPVSTRSCLGFENQVGALSNHLLLRNRLDESDDFSGFVKQVRKSVIDAMVHRDFPISLVTKRVRVRGVPAGAVPFPLKFNMPKAHMLKGDMAEQQAGPSRLTVALEAFKAELEILDRRVTGNSELNLGFFETRQGLLGTLQYNVELFDESTIAEMVARLSHLAEIVSTGRSITVGELANACGAIRRAGAT